MRIVDIITTIGVPALIVGFIYMGRKLQALEDLLVVTNKIKSNLKVVSDFLTRNNTNFNPTELQAYSPLKLTPQGEDFIKKIGFEEVFLLNKDDFSSYISSENPKLKYDVELAAIKSLSVFYDKEYMNFLKVFFYNNPDRSIENTAPTLGIYIRDRYLAEHPEITE